VRGNDKAAEAWVKTKRLWLAACLLAAACGSDPKEGADSDDVFGVDGGRKDGGSGKGDDVCGAHTVRSDRAIPDMLIVLDRSGSMAREGNATRTDRWSGSRDAVQEVTAMFDTSIHFGLMTFPSAGGFGGGDQGRQCSAGSVNVPIGSNTASAIAQTLSPMRASGYTPTAATLEAARDVIGGPPVADQTLTSPKFILLVTDGDPNCSEDWSASGGMGGIAPPDPVARTESIAAIDKLTKQGVQTFVVGFQTAGTDFSEQLDKMAAAGGTGQKTHRSVDSGDDLAIVFQELAGRAASCSYSLAQKVDPEYVLVSVAGKTRRYNNTEDGWTMSDDGKTVSLTGAACDAAQKGGAFTVNVTCDPVIGI
jgi:Mg-chelatase subunit ChlD